MEISRERRQIPRFVEDALFGEHPQTGGVQLGFPFSGPPFSGSRLICAVVQPIFSAPKLAPGRGVPGPDQSLAGLEGGAHPPALPAFEPEGSGLEKPLLHFFWFFGSVHFYWGSAKNSQVFATIPRVEMFNWSLFGFGVGLFWPIYLGSEPKKSERKRRNRISRGSSPCYSFHFQDPSFRKSTPREISWFLKRPMVDWNGESTPRKASSGSQN